MRRIAVLLLALLTASNPLPQAINTTLVVSQIFLPIISKPVAALGMGLAWATIAPYGESVNADWWYRGGEGTAPSYPQPDYLAYPSQCRDWMLIFNEPDPGGNQEWLFTPQDAASKSHRIRQLCPRSLFAAGNVSQFGRTWLQQYLALGGEYDWLGFHSYCLFWEDCVNTIQEFRNAFPNDDLCLTEWNVVAHDPLTAYERFAFGTLMQYVKDNLQCSAVFTDRYVDGQNSMSLFRENKTTLNEIGVIYANRNN